MTSCARVCSISLVIVAVWAVGTAAGAAAAKEIAGRDTEFAEFVVFLNQELFTRCPPRLWG